MSVIFHRTHEGIESVGPPEPVEGAGPMERDPAHAVPECLLQEINGAVAIAKERGDAWEMIGIGLEVRCDLPFVLTVTEVPYLPSFP